MEKLSGEKLIEWADHWAGLLGPWGYVALVFAALIEYLFPPFPGDSVVALGGAWAIRTSQSWLGVWVAVTAGNLLGMALQHRIGCAWAQRRRDKEPGRVARKLASWGLTEARIARAKEQMRKQGVALLVLNRFVPSFRALVFLAAGASGVSFRKTMAFGALGSLVWSAFILGLGAWLGGNAELLLKVLERYQTVASWGVVAALAGWLTYALIKRRPKGAA